ncbi:MAG TPA: ribonuclease Z, partial [Candidatus Woesearchaeota archaeon]|nr:ribonuclease Z [Candidatus Woesearchaeota archaeon]
LIYKSEEYNIECLELKHKIPTIGFALVENPKRKMNMDFMKKMKIPQGPLWNKLQKGQTVTHNGKKITPDEATTLVPGKKIAYVTDTLYCTNAVKLAEDADVLLSDSTFLSDKEEMAEEYTHLTAKRAAEIANKANVKKLVLIHFSQRYKTTADLEEEARTYFPNTKAAHDFMKIKV